MKANWEAIFWPSIYLWEGKFTAGTQVRDPLFLVLIIHGYALTTRTNVLAQYSGMKFKLKSRKFGQVVF